MKPTFWAKYAIAVHLAIDDVIKAQRAKILKPCLSSKFLGFFFPADLVLSFISRVDNFLLNILLLPLLFSLRLSFDPCGLVLLFVFLPVFLWFRWQRTSLHLHFHKSSYAVSVKLDLLHLRVTSVPSISPP